MLLLSSKLNFNMAYLFRNGFIPEYYSNALFTQYGILLGFIRNFVMLTNYVISVEGERMHLKWRRILSCSFCMIIVHLKINRLT